jgi:hypothetical protein
MHRQWLNLTGEGTYHNLLSLLKDSQYELFLDKFSQARSILVGLPNFAYTIAAVRFAIAKEYEACMSFIKEVFPREKIVGEGEVTYRVLDMASEDRHYNLSHHLYKAAVEPGYLNPPTGMCLNLLSTFAQAGDSPMLHSVLSQLVSKGEEIGEYHFEKLLECHINNDDLSSACLVFTAMASRGIEPSDTTSNPLYVYLQSSAELAKTAFATLYVLSTSNVPRPYIPLSPLNAILASLINHHQDLGTALKCYKLFHVIRPQGSFANTRTFNLLLKGCADAEKPRKDLALFLASEMSILKIKADSGTYHELIRVCARAEDWRYVCRYVEEAVLAKVELGEELEARIKEWNSRGVFDFEEIESQTEPVRERVHRSNTSDTVGEHGDRENTKQEQRAEHHVG